MARGAFWTIIVDDKPTAFRAPVREDLLPTLKQLQRQQPAAAIKWFQRGRLWETPGDAMDATKPPRRGPGWRPGGEHKDPREQYKVPRDVKRARWASQAAEGRGPWVKGKTEPPRDQRRPDGERAERPGEARSDDRPRSARPAGDKPGWRPKPAGDGGGTGDRPRRPRSESDRPWSPKPKGAWTRDRDSRGPRESGKPPWRPKADEARAPRAPRGDKTGWKPVPGGRPPGNGRPPTGTRAPGARAGTAPRQDSRGDRDRRDAPPSASADRSRPPAKKSRSWRAGELPPADRKRKKDDD